MRKQVRLFLLLQVLSAVTVWAQSDAPDPAIIQKIREEGLQHSQVMDIAHHLTDESGPRLTNSPGFMKAAQWAVAEMKSWGMKSNLEAWGDFGPGWELQRSYIAMKVPYYHPIIAHPFAWTKGTNGMVTADVVFLQSLSEEAISKYKGSFQGKVVLAGVTDTVLRSAFDAYANRYTDKELDSLKDSDMFTEEMLNGMIGYFNGIRAAMRHLQKLGCVAVLNARTYNRDGTIDVAQWYTGKKDELLDLLTFEVGTEDYLSMQRLLERGKKVQIELEVKSRMIPENTKAYNVIGEIPGTDPTLKSELVMLGGHLDSWHSGTGATDNAAGCAVMMEAARILHALNLQPKRTIRVALWSGEEQGLLGSHAYVTKHFGDPVTMKLLPEQSKVSVYYNLDNGTGKIRGIYLQNNEAVRPIFQQWLQPFNDLGATAITSSNTGATDHLSFDAVGIPGFQFVQDPMEYETRTHHTNMDDYDHLSPDDLKQASTIIAAFVYLSSVRAEKIPRKPLPDPGPWLFDSFKLK
ncbi:MAG: peptidase M28 [Bacteroidetes bacterium]|nr:MAG: peptidase M28 [Bacteroidota bacterium]